MGVYEYMLIIVGGGDEVGRFYFKDGTKALEIMEDLAEASKDNAFECHLTIVPKEEEDF